MTNTIERRRVATRNLRVEDGVEGAGPKLCGYAAVFESSSVLMGCIETIDGEEVDNRFYEVITRGAFDESLRTGDIRALKNHNEDMILGRTRAGTLKLWEDDLGLGFEIPFPCTSYAMDLAESLRRGDLDGCSFGFLCDDGDDEVEDRGDGILLRRLNKINLIEVSLGVTFPAYLASSVAIRSARQAILKASVTKTVERKRRLERAMRELTILDLF